MTIDEARKKIGFTNIASVHHAIKTGQIRVNEDGSVREESVDQLIDRRSRNAEMRELFLMDDSDMTLAQRKKLRNWK